MRRCIWPALLLAVVTSHVPARVLAQDGEAYRVAAYFGDSAESDDFISGDRYAGAEDAGGRALAASNGLQSLGRKVWPLVRKYIWLSTFAGDDLFVGYSQPLDDVESGELQFSLLIDRATWSSYDPSERQEKLYQANVQFEDRMSELNLKGSMKIVLTSR